jgi:hypothetical protein
VEEQAELHSDRQKRAAVSREQTIAAAAMTQAAAPRVCTKVETCPRCRVIVDVSAWLHKKKKSAVQTVTV